MTERSPRAYKAFVLAAAPTDAGLLQSVELSGELIFQRYQRQRRYLIASTAATIVDDDDDDDDDDNDDDDAKHRCHPGPP